MKIVIIILHFGNIEVTKKCITSFQRFEKKYNIIVVNNMPIMYKSNNFSKKKIIVINNKKNLGFAGGVNVGIRYALKYAYKAVLLVNNDTKITRPIISRLSSELVNVSTGIVSPAIRFKKDNHVVYDLGGKINTITSKTTHNEVSKINDKKKIHPMYVSGCCMLIKREVFKKVGFLDDDFFLYYEDVDFCLRTKHAGFDITLLPAVVIEHELSKSAGKMSKIAIYNLTKSLIYFGKKYFNSGIKKYIHRLFVLYQSFVFFTKSPYGLYAWKAILEN